MRFMRTTREATLLILLLTLGNGSPLLLVTKVYAQAQQSEATTPTQSAERAYREAAQKDYAAAIADFRNALAGDASNSAWRRDLAFALLASGDANGALAEFRTIYGQDPNDAAIAMQLGYLYSSAGKKNEAKRMFAAARVAAADAPDPEKGGKIVAQASAELAALRGDSKSWFASIYAAPFYQSRFDNEINPAAAQAGLKPSPYFQPYIGLRFTRDVRSKTGTLPQIFSDNAAIFSFGVQSAIAGTGAVVYGEAGTAVNLMNTGPRDRPDYRSGARWFRSWGRGYSNPASRLAHAGFAYADASWYSRYGGNVIGYVQVREGASLPTGRALPMLLLAAVNFNKDSQRVFYNNAAEAGPLVRVGPFRRVPFVTLEAEYLRGFYTTHDATNPYGPRYSDTRVSLVFSRSF